MLKIHAKYEQNCDPYLVAVLKMKWIRSWSLTEEKERKMCVKHWCKANKTNGKALCQ